MNQPIREEEEEEEDLEERGEQKGCLLCHRNLISHACYHLWKSSLLSKVVAQRSH